MKLSHIFTFRFKHCMNIQRLIKKGDVLTQYEVFQLESNNLYTLIYFTFHS